MVLLTHITHNTNFNDYTPCLLICHLLVLKLYYWHNLWHLQQWRPSNPIQPYPIRCIIFMTNIYSSIRKFLLVRYCCLLSSPLSTFSLQSFSLLHVHRHQNQLLITTCAPQDLVLIPPHHHNIVLYHNNKLSSAQSYPLSIYYQIMSKRSSGRTPSTLLLQKLAVLQMMMLMITMMRRMKY